MKKILLLVLCTACFSVFSDAQKLIAAIEARNYTEVEQLLQAGEKVNKGNKKGLFPLWIAVWNNDTVMAKLLVRYEADVQQKFRNKDGRLSCLDVACQEGFFNITQILVSNGAEVNDRGLLGFSPLRIAARNGRLDIVQYLVSRGSEIDSEADDRATPMEHAAGKGHLEIVKLLVEHGADVNHQDKDRDTPLGEAAMGGFLDVVMYLVSKGADLSIKNKDGYTAEDRAKLAGQAKVEVYLKQHK